MSEPWIFWDFDGTLANRQVGWTDCLTGVVQRHYPDLAATTEDIRPLMSTGFPWHTPAATHHDLSDVSGDDWWRQLFQHFDKVLDTVGCTTMGREHAFDEMRHEYVKPERFDLADGVVETLDLLAEAGWRHLIVSNHVPELPDIVAGLAIADRFADVITSARVGVEKPNPEIFKIARTLAGDPETAWMIGDNLVADIDGGLNAGLQPIFIGSPTTACPCPVVASVPEVAAVIFGG